MWISKESHSRWQKIRAILECAIENCLEKNIFINNLAAIVYMCSLKVLIICWSVLWVQSSLLIDWCFKWANTQRQVCCVCGNVFKRRFINDEVDLVDEDNDSGQAPAVTLMEQQEIYWIAGEYTHSVDMSTIRNLFGAPRNLDLEHILTVPDAGSWGRNAKLSSLHSLSGRP